MNSKIPHHEGQRIGVIDYGLGNVGSIRNMLRRVGVLADIVSEPEQLSGMDRAILPGIGHFKYGMSLLEAKGWPTAIDEFVNTSSRPFLGICLGMQLLAVSSQEGAGQGLGLVKGEVRHFDRNEMNKNLPVPHMGWATVQPNDSASLFTNLPKDARFYFTHSLHISVDADPSVAAGITNYGYPFVSAIQKDNLFGVQFHPEKSHIFGMALLENFSRVVC